MNRMSRITKQQHEIQLQQILRLMLESKTQEEIAHQLNVNVRTIQRYTLEIDKRYGEMQRQKTDNTLFMECQLFKNRLLKMYRILEQKALDPKTNGTETAKCCEVAFSIAIDVLRLEAEGIKAVKNGLVSIASATAHKNAFNNIRKYDNEDDGPNHNSRHNQNQRQHQEKEDYNNNRKF
jgi:hypothetical protein